MFLAAASATAGAARALTPPEAHAVRFGRQDTSGSCKVRHARRLARTAPRHASARGRHRCTVLSDSGSFLRSIGQVPPDITGALRNPRVTAVVAFSPPGAAPGFITDEGYGRLDVPAFIQTGDRDVPLIGSDRRWQAHLTAYEAAAAGDKYALVLDGVDHYFGGLICELDAPGPAQHAQLSSMVALSSIFMDAHGARDGTALRMLDGALTQIGPVQLSRK